MKNTPISIVSQNWNLKKTWTEQISHTYILLAIDLSIYLSIYLNIIYIYIYYTYKYVYIQCISVCTEFKLLISFGFAIKIGGPELDGVFPIVSHDKIRNFYDSLFLILPVSSYTKASLTSCMNGIFGGANFHFFKMWQTLKHMHQICNHMYKNRSVNLLTSQITYLRTWVFPKIWENPQIIHLFIGLEPLFSPSILGGLQKPPPIFLPQNLALTSGRPKPKIPSKGPAVAP